MILHSVTDWDAAYANMPNIPGGEAYPDIWAASAKAYRAELESKNRARLGLAYGDGERNRFDLFMPEGEPKGLVVFVHGGYWMRFDESFWSHLARGSVENGWAVAMPTYTLTPQVRVSDITNEIGKAVETAAGMIAGPIRLTGHSAGGHLVTRMISSTSPLSAAVQKRIAHTLSISGVHDLRPLLNTGLNETLRLDASEAAAESPVLLSPTAGARLTCWVGAGERAEFLRQNALLGNVWTGLGAATAIYEEPDRHHFNVVDGLAEPAHPLTRTLLAA